MRSRNLGERTAMRDPLGAAPVTRRDWLGRLGAGFGLVGLANVLEGETSRATPPAATNPLAARAPHLPARAKHVIFLFMNGGPSHVDTFDPKPKLTEQHGRPAPDSLK